MNNTNINNSTLLDSVNAPSDIKKFNIYELYSLSAEIREFLVQSISKTGGHLASNLGVVELTIALHYCFNLPFDSIVWDVGHQCYTHKILTGRKSSFDTIRQYNGISGFPKSKESKYDSFDTGHSSTSISIALANSYASVLENKKNRSIAVIGDGSLTGGLAYEALNNAGRSDTNIIVILNDNEMSISQNVGALSSHLTGIRTRPSYFQTKRTVEAIVAKIPFLGSPLKKWISGAKSALKHTIVEGIMFEELGFQYIGPIDGHNLKELTSTFLRIKKMSGPIFVHVKTVKGKGYTPAEVKPEIFHGIGKFDVATGKVKQSGLETFSDIFGKTLIELAGKNSKIVAVTAAMMSGTGLDGFFKRFPNRLFDVGIAESHALTFSAGLSKQGFIPFAAIYSSFLQRGFDQLIHDIALQNLHVVIAIDRAGIVGNDGETHQGIYDLSFLSLIPNIVIMSPKGKNEFIAMLHFAVNKKCPIAIRYSKAAAKEDTLYQKIVYGKFEVIKKGIDIAILSVGEMTNICEQVVNKLYQKGIYPTFINVRFINPLDESQLKNIFKTHKYIFTVEDNIRKGGFGSKILEFAAEQQYNGRIINIALPDKFIEQGDRDELLAKYGLSAEGIYNKINYITLGGQSIL